MTLDPALAWAASLVLAGVFAAAALTKLRAAEAFAAVVANYRILPPTLAAVAAHLLPIVELAAAIGLVWPPTRAVAAGLAGLLLLAFAGAMAINLQRGRRDIDCGCYVGLLRQRLAWPLVVRNLMLATAALAVASGAVSGRQLGVLDGIAVVAAVGAMFLLYAAFGRLVGVAPVVRTGASA